LANCYWIETGKVLKERTLITLFVVAILIATVPLATLSQEPDERVKQAIESGDIQGAIGLLQSAIEADHSFYFNYYLLGKLHYDQMQYTQAKDQFELALDKKSKHWESLHLYARTLIALGLYEEASEAVNRGLKKAKNLKAVFENAAGLLASAREDYEEADRCFRRALAESETGEKKKIKDLRNSPGTDEERQRAIDSLIAANAKQNAEFHINLGDANFYQGVPGLAIIEYEKALQIDTASTEVYFHWAEACLELKDYNCAIEKLSIVLSKDSTYAPAWNRAGGIYYKAARSSRQRTERKARFMDAIGSYKKYLQLTDIQPDSSNARVFFELAMAYASINGFEDAAPYFEKVLSIPMEPRDIYFYFGKSLWGIRNYDRSAEMLLKHIEWVEQQDEEYKSSIRDAELYQLLGDSYYYCKPKQFSKAVKYYKKSLEDHPEQKRVLQNVAVAYHSLKSYGQAIEYYDLRIALGIDSNSVSIYKNAGLCALNIAGNAGEDEDEEFEEEEEFVESAGGVDPNKNYNEIAISYMDRFLEYVPNDTTVILRIANTYLYQLEDCTNGVQYFERLLALTPDNCQAKKSLGYAYFGGLCNKSYSKALGYLTDAYQCFSKTNGACADPALVKWVAQCYHLRAVDKTGDTNSDYKNAIEWYRKYLKCEPNDEEAQESLNDIIFEVN